MPKTKEVTTKDLLIEFRLLNKRLDKRFDGIDKRFDGIDKRLDGMDGRMDGMDSRLDKLTIAVVNIQEELKDKVSYGEFYKFKDQVMAVLDRLTKSHENHESEHVANLAAHERIQGDVNECRKKIGLRVKYASI